MATLRLLLGSLGCVAFGQHDSSCSRGQCRASVEDGEYSALLQHRTEPAGHKGECNPKNHPDANVNPEYGVYKDEECEERSLVGCAAGGLPPICRYCYKIPELAQDGMENCEDVKGGQEISLIATIDSLGSDTGKVCKNKYGFAFTCGEHSTCCGNACAGAGSKCCGKYAWPPVDMALWYPITEETQCIYGSFPHSPGQKQCRNKDGVAFFCGENSTCCGNACAGAGSKCCGKYAWPPVDMAQWYPISKSTQCLYGSFPFGKKKGQQQCKNKNGYTFFCGQHSTCCGNACAGAGSKCCGKDAFPPVDMAQWYPITEATYCIYDR